MKVKIKRFNKEARLPTYGHAGDAGFDLYTPAEVKVAPNERVQIATGLGFELADGYAGLVWDKSGLSHKHGLKVLGGVLDSGYRGELLVGLVNLSDEEYVLEKGHKVAQMLIQRVEQVEFEEVEEFTDTSRGKGGFGSTGK